MAVLAICAAVVVVGAVLLFTPLGIRPLEAVFSVGEIEKVEFEQLVLSGKPNQYLICPRGYCSGASGAETSGYDVPVKQLRKAWGETIASEPRVEVLAQHGDMQVDYVQRSAWFRFPDIITVRFIPQSASRSTLAVYSRSVYGHSDFGVNKRRVEGWIQKLRAAVEK